jgi:hypothetical protein
VEGRDGSGMSAADYARLFERWDVVALFERAE